MVSTAEDEEAATAANTLSALEAEAYVEALAPLRLDEYGSPKWHQQHEYLEKLNLQSHYNIIHRGDEFVKEALVDLDKMPTVIHELIAAEIWKHKVWPMIEADISEHSRIRAYNCLYHEATIAALIEATFFHSDACEAAGERAMEMVDYCARKVHWLVTRPPPSTKARSTKEIIAEAEDEVESLKVQADEINFNCAMVALTMLRYLTDHMHALHVSVAQRLVKHHDFVASLAALLDIAPWKKTEKTVIETADEENEGKTKKHKTTRHKVFEDNKWNMVEPGSRVICKPEAQVWLALYNLIMSAGQAATGMGYPMDNSRKPNVEKLKKYLNDVLTDQLPPLKDLRRVVEEIGMMDLGAAEESSFIIEQVSEMREAIIADQDWDKLSTGTLAAYFQMTKDERQQEIMKMNDMYSMFDLGDLDDGGKISEPALLDKHGSVGLAKLFLAGGDGVDKNMEKAVYYFQLSAENGDAEGQYCYGQRLKKGQGVPKDVPAAVEMFTKAAEQAHTNAMNWLAHMYEKGDGVTASADEAVRFNRMAAEAGDAWALTKMGMRCLKGEGVAVDDAEARVWLEKAAEKGSKAAIAKLHELDADDLD